MVDDNYLHSTAQTLVVPLKRASEYKKTNTYGTMLIDYAMMYRTLRNSISDSGLKSDLVNDYDTNALHTVKSDDTHKKELTELENVVPELVEVYVSNLLNYH
jgi:hypothetical protein